MLKSTAVDINPGQAIRPRFSSLYFAIPLMLGVVWLLGIRPTSGAAGAVINSALVFLSAALVAGIAGRRKLQQLICVIAACMAAFVLLQQIGTQAEFRLATQSVSILTEAFAVIYIALAIGLLSVRTHSLTYAIIVVFMPVQIVLLATVNLYDAIGDMARLPLLFRVSEFSAGAYLLFGMAILIQVMMRPTASEPQSRIWPPAAAASGLVGVLISVYLINSGFFAIVSAVTGSLLIGATYLGCAASITRRAMFRMHLALKRDVRYQQRQQEILRAIQVDYEELFEEVPTGVLKSSPKGQITGANGRMCELLGYASVEQLKATELRALFVDPERRYRDFLCWQNTGSREWAGDVEMVKRDGTTITAKFVGCRVNDESGELLYMLYCYTDVSEQRQTAKDKEKLEDELRLMHKLEAVGRVAAGVAHEINTPMQYIGDNVHFLSTAYTDLRALAKNLTIQLREQSGELPGRGVDEAIAKLEDEADLVYLDETVSGAFERTLEGVNSVAEIVRTMKEFAYPSDDTPVMNDINDTLGKALTVCRNTYSSSAEIETSLGELPLTYCHAGALSQVFVNLIINASHAVESANETLGRSMGEIRVTTIAADGWIEISVADNGCGMPEAVMTRIFDPFFTTKDVGKGTGQGLAIAHSIITEKHGGTIAVESEARRGTTFTVRLPIRDESD